MLRSGIGFDIHRFTKGRPLVLGGVEVDSRVGLEGHSDADVLTHAIMDALLGAVADGDIGQHFPNTDPQWKNARSVELLKRVAQRLGSGNADIVNVDATLMAEKPMVAPYVESMRKTLARAMGISPTQVSVKATTCERLGAIGRAEGIAAMAVAMVDARDGARFVAGVEWDDAGTEEYE